MDMIGYGISRLLWFITWGIILIVAVIVGILHWLIN